MIISPLIGVAFWGNQRYDNNEFQYYLNPIFIKNKWYRNFFTRGSKLKKYTLLLMALLALGLTGLTTQQTAQASSMHRAKVSRPIHVYHWIWGSSFATSRTGKSLYLPRGKHIKIARFYHMGPDGFMLYVAGHGKTLWYARTNSSSWFYRY